MKRKKEKNTRAVKLTAAWIIIMLFFYRGTLSLYMV